ncbi:hypothetical protein HanXRQr2_Chr15g0698661 [Helianthus annuus]|uniref:Uncharacterized protein n=1 Tax=Helianthus annuus TaxID=4232 RepID=A0A9K3H505_HELAN|nr:hypothetical protein HanXRQr2_Chr15g0698661 [Helianthus annuus]KAJ0831720.1 hypothetical protein HanPSC8_Chr15g0670331 [Helianthus annuus]
MNDPTPFDPSGPTTMTKRYQNKRQTYYGSTNINICSVLINIVRSERKKSSKKHKWIKALLLNVCLYY